jgi:hypothetical protein
MSLATSVQATVAKNLAIHYQGILILRRLNEEWDSDEGEWVETGKPTDYVAPFAAMEFSELSRAMGSIPKGARKLTIAAEGIPRPRIDGETDGVRHKADVIYTGDWDKESDAKISTAGSSAKVLDVDVTGTYNNVAIVYTMTAAA